MCYHRLAMLGDAFVSLAASSFCVQCTLFNIYIYIIYIHMFNVCNYIISWMLATRLKVHPLVTQTAQTSASCSTSSYYHQYS